MSPTEAPPPRGEDRFIPAARAALLAAVALAFLPALWNGFVDWDDAPTLVENFLFRGGPESLAWMFGTFHMGHYMPLTWLSYALDYRLWGMDPFGFHLSNLLLHALNAQLFFGLGLRLLSRASGVSAREAAPGALAAALLFALHPLRVESVAWATERRDLLAAFFLLAALRAYLDRGAGARFNGLYALSLLSKSAGMALPAALAVLDVYPLRRLPADPRRWTDPDYRAVWREKVPPVLLALAAAGVSAAAQIGTNTALTLAEHGPAARAAQFFEGAFFYLGKTLWPAGLSPLYEIPTEMNAARAWLAAAAFAAVTVWLVRKRREAPGALAAWVVYLAFFAPTSGLLQSGPQWAADRYTYFSCAPWALLAGGAVAGGRAAAVRRALFAAAIAASAALGMAAWRQCFVWRDPGALWSRAAALNPGSYIARRNLGLQRLREGRYEEAADLFMEARRLKPGSADALNDLGFAKLQLGRGEEARGLFEDALRRDPGHAEALNNLGTWNLAAGDAPAAERHFERALARRPRFTEARVNLGIARARTGRLDDALRSFEAAARERPDLPQAFHNAGLAKLAQEDRAGAEESFRAALRADPGFRPAAEALKKMGSAP